MDTATGFSETAVLKEVRLGSTHTASLVCEGRCNPTAALVADLIESRPRIEVDGNRFTRQLSDIDITRLRALVHTSHVFTRMIARATVIREVWRCEVCGHERIYGSNDSIVKEETTP